MNAFNLRRRVQGPGIPTAGGSSFLVDLSAFSVVFGPELLADPLFDNWSGDNPVGWTVNNESAGVREITEVGSGEDHTGAGTGSCCIWDTGTTFCSMVQALFTANQFYQVKAAASASAGASTAVRMDIGALDLRSRHVGATGISSVGLAKGTNLILVINAVGERTLDNASVKLVTPQAFDVPANAEHTLFLSLPASPPSDSGISYKYRYQDVLNHWTLEFYRASTLDKWSVELRSISAGVNTVRIATPVAYVPAGIRIRAVGSTHQVYGLNGATWEQIGPDVTVSHLDAQTGSVLVYTDNVVPDRLTVEAVSS